MVIEQKQKSGSRKVVRSSRRKTIQEISLEKGTHLKKTVFSVGRKVVKIGIRFR